MEIRAGGGCEGGEEGGPGEERPDPGGLQRTDASAAVRCFYHVATEPLPPDGGPPAAAAGGGSYARCATRYGGPLTLRGAGVYRVTAYATARGAADSDMAEAVFEVQHQARPVHVDPVRGSFRLAVTLTARCDTGGAGILVDARHHLLPAPAPDEPLADAAAAAAEAAAAGGGGDSVRRRGAVLHGSGRLLLTLDRRDEALFDSDGLVHGPAQLQGGGGGRCGAAAGAQEGGERPCRSSGRTACTAGLRRAKALDGIGPSAAYPPAALPPCRPAPAPPYQAPSAAACAAAYDP